TRASLNGNRRSVLIGINYSGLSSPSELRGCVNDVKRMRPFVERLGFPSNEGSQMVLLDDGSTPLAPTMANIRGAIAWLVEGAAAGDALFFQYSGHGGRIQGSDGFHETLCPLDMASEGQLLDTELFETLVAPLPSGCRLTVILDSCHSAGALNLPFLFTGTEGNLKSALAGEAVQMAMSRNWLRDVIAITGCRSDQTSADVGNVDLQFDLQPTARSGAGGALTSAFIEALDGREAAPSYLELLEAIRLKLAEEGFTQVPQLASSLLVDLTSAFSML
ncbi:putative metacaspase protein, partial [Emiliania huxleyi CCMP1516]|uniref:Peptidase C14 caspase domain-containing protein n=2 Tax=Emiliania huxleyi TaxID=2903 RepID=A0A0D3JDF1_EMIH1